MAYNVLTSVAYLFTVVVGPLQVLSVIAFYLLRRHPVFAIRVPMVVLVCMILKLISFFCVSWLFIDSDCPCIVSTIMLWLEFSANIFSVMRKVVLLFRFEIQAALEQSKFEPGAKVFDNNNVFVRYREILRPRTQLTLMFVFTMWVGLPLGVLLGVFNDLALQPCATAVIGDNKLVMSSIITAFISSAPALFISPWATRKLRKFPHDNWKMGVESTAHSAAATLFVIVCIIVLSVVPGFEGFLLLFFTFSIFAQFLTIIVPLHLKHRMVRQLAELDIEKLTSLQRLLQDPEFLASFDAFLHKEFSSENLFFWLEVNKLQGKYITLFGTDEMASQSSLSEERKKKTELNTVPEVLPITLRKAAEDCLELGQKCIGDKAPRQINVSGFTGDDIVKALEDITHMLLEKQSEQSEQQLKLAVEETLRSFAVAQIEVYESLRKDSFPRFLLSSAAKKLNQNEHLKRLLAAERLEGELRKTNTETKESSKSSASDHAFPPKNDSRRSEVHPRLTLGAPLSDSTTRSSFGSTGVSAEKQSRDELSAPPGKESRDEMSPEKESRDELFSPRKGELPPESRDELPPSEKSVSDELLPPEKESHEKLAARRNELLPPEQESRDELPPEKESRDELSPQKESRDVLVAVDMSESFE